MKNSVTNIKTILISRTDSIGDAVLTLPMAKVLKDAFPGVRIGFMGKAYTKALVDTCSYVDEFIEIASFLKNKITVCGLPPDAIIHVFPVSDIAKRARQLNIPLRIGTTNRLYHWFTCNKLIRLSRKKSDLHEAQLNLKLLSAFGIEQTFSLPDITGMYGLQRIQPLQSSYSSLLAPGKYNIILHPKSRGSAVEWGIENFISLVQLLDETHYNIFISGTAEERKDIEFLFAKTGEKVTDIMGKMELAQFISFIGKCNGFVACSTGPLHIAAALGKDAYGLYSIQKPIHAGRWQPVGKHVFLFESYKKREEKNMDDVLPQTVWQAIENNRIRYLNAQTG